MNAHGTVTGRATSSYAVTRLHITFNGAGSLTGGTRAYAGIRGAPLAFDAVHSITGRREADGPHGPRHGPVAAGLFSQATHDIGCPRAVVNPYALPSFIASLPFFILGLTALSLNPRDRTSRLLSAMCLAFMLSGIAVGLFHLSESLDDALVWNRWPYAIILPGVLVIMEYCLDASGREDRLRERLFGVPVARHRIAAIITLAAAWVLAIATDWIITTPEHNAATGWEHGYGPGFPVFLVAITYVLGLFVYILWRGVQAATEPMIRRFRQISLLALGGGMLLASLFGFLLPGLFGWLTHSFAFLPLVVTIFLLTYGLMRYQYETILDLSRGLEAKVGARTEELTSANAKLNEVQGQISALPGPERRQADLRRHDEGDPRSPADQAHAVLLRHRRVHALHGLRGSGGCRRPPQRVPGRHGEPRSRVRRHDRAVQR